MNVRWSAISILAALSACTVQAVVVNVDIDARTSDANASRQGILFSGQGAYADVGNDYWNSISTDERAISSLIASDGSTVSSVGISVSGGDGYVHTGITNYLLADYFYGSTTTTLTGLEPGGAYTLYVYAVGDQSGQGSTVTIGSDVQVTTGDNSGVYALGGNYVVFAANADPSGEMVISSSDKLTGLQLVGDTPEPVYNLVHPGMSHKQSDLDRMKYQVAARVEPWYSSYQEMCQDSKADYNYAVQGSSTNRVIYRDAPRTNKSAFESDSRAAYYNAIRWVVEGDTRYANKAVEIFNAWTGIRYVQHSGTTTLSGSMIYIMLEAAEMVKSTYSGWSAADRQAFGDMLVYPGWSGTTVPPNLDSAYEDGGEGSWYWRVYKGDRARAGNQELSGWRACMAIGIFLDNEIIYDRAMRYVAGMDHRTDDLAYEPGPNIAVNAFTTTPYNVSYTHEQQDSIPDYGYDGVLTNYVYETGQCAEAARDQGHASWGLNCLESLAEMAWNQGDDLWGLEDSRLLLGLEYHTRYNLSYLQTFSDQPTPWEPTVESGEFVSRLNRVARSKCLAINPYFEYDFTSVSRGAVDRAQWELPIAHYVGRGFVSSTNEARWITRTRDYNIAQDGYEETDAGGAQVGWGAFTFRRPEHSYGDPVSGIVSNVPVFAVHQLPGTLEAELYDWSPVSGEGRTFHDTTPGNSGGEYRTDGDVDIEVCSEGGYALADIEDGEWVSYTVNMMTSGVYGISVRYAAAEEVAVRVSLGGIDLTGDVMLPATGSSNVWNSCVISEHLSLPAGVQGLRIYFSNAADSYRFKSLTLTEGPAVAHPTIRIEAEDYVSQSGTVTEATSDAGGGSNIGSLSDGDWTMYGSYALGANASIRFRMARPSGKAVGRIEVRLGSSTGTLIGSMAMPETGGWQTWETYETDLDPVIGTQPLVLVFVEDEASTQGGDMMNLNWIELVIPAEPAAPNGLAASPVDRSRIALSWDSVERASQYNLKRGTTGGGPYSAIAIGPTVTQYTDSGLLAGTNYVYVISTTTDGVESDDSAEVSAVPSAPLNPGDVEIGTVEVVSDGNGGREFRVSVTASEPGHSYQVWTADRLVSPSWEPAGGVIPGNGAELEIDLPIIGSETNLFYKLEAWRQ